MIVNFSDKVKRALSENSPILALESTILAHGMPFPHNLKLAEKINETCYSFGVTPATVAILNGIPYVGLNQKQLNYITKSGSKLKKTPMSDLGLACLKKHDAATTVSSSIHLASLAKIKVFATGGLGGVHRNYNDTLDISQDLKVLSDTNIITVSSGVKLILDVKKTIEKFESLGITIVGYKTNDLPGFYSRSSGVKLEYRINKASDISSLFLLNQKLKLKNSILVMNPVSKRDEVSLEKIEPIINSALELATRKGLRGKETTPFLLKSVVEKSMGDSLSANISLAINNAVLGCKISKSLYNS